MLLVSSSDTSLPIRNQNSPLLFGDKFNAEEGDFYLIYAADHIAKGFYHDKATNLVCLAKFEEDQFFKHFKFDHTANDFSDSMRHGEEYMLLAKMTPNQEIITMNHLAYTVAIAANYHGYTYDSRYCFSDTVKLPRICHALFWFIQFKSIYSLPIGNCAYRGYKGSEPIVSVDSTLNYYKRLEEYSKFPLIDGLDLHDYCKVVTDNILTESQATLSDKIKALKS